MPKNTKQSLEDTITKQAIEGATLLKQAIEEDPQVGLLIVKELNTMRCSIYQHPSLSELAQVRLLALFNTFLPLLAKLKDKLDETEGGAQGSARFN